jgi:hypothetical protein
MSTWTDKTLIRGIKAYASNGDEIEDAYALRDSDGDYRTPERRLLRDKSGPIAAGEEVTAVPTSALKRLQDAFRGAAGGSSGLPGDKLAAILEITSYLPVDKPGPLDQAVADAKNTSALGILEDFTLNDRISLLLDAVRDTHTGEDLRYRLARVVRLAYTWADLEDPSRDAVEDIRNRAAAEAGRCGGDLATLARLVGELAARASEGRSPRPALLALGSRALAWAAESSRTVSDVDVQVGHLPGPYRLDVAYAGGQPIGVVEKIVMDAPNPDRLGPYIRQALTETFEVELSEGYSEGWEA